MKGSWVNTSQRLPSNGLLVATKIDDKDGLRNECRLRRQNNLWFCHDGSMYVYYTPTHWFDENADPRLANWLKK